MRLPRFDIVEPVTLAEAVGQLDAHWPDARVVAGGTSFLVLMKQRVRTPKLLVSLERIADCRGITFDPNSGLSIGALATLRQVAASPIVRQHYPALAQAAGAVASPQIRNRATVGGNLCLDKRCWFFNQSATWRAARSPCLRAGGDTCSVVQGAELCYSLVTADTATVLVALGAQVIVEGPLGQRRVRVEELYPGLGNDTTVLGRGELVAQVQVPPPAPGSVAIYLRHSTRGAIDYPLVQVATVMQREDGICRDARIVVGAVSPRPMRAKQAEMLLTGRQLTPELASQAGAEAIREVKPIPYIFRTPEYKRMLTRAFVEQALLSAAGLAPAELD